MSLPSALYNSKTFGEKKFEVDPSKPQYQTTNGATTGPSEHVLNAGQVDIDRPSEPKLKEDNSNQVTYLSNLRCQLTGLQDDINVFLTEKMELAKGKKIKVASNKDTD
ncbi:hypothetical protein TPHA_0A02650 [Tetrapisispora phaffii CBS 4417]|uniref:EKC/KEOPS complex subunit GON7 n=1 Tax=Tetrapisispora phaffii (strain ATCC 24235 / CBS 4417 / NBRC 1672 / NRRL Y-8282 / UCD 70-5) TaxID=1071381 RepID=G8BN69_TETPH|nr:hypothetical protein TPHA_0A02650 [Tetrapisispora phaffii CBS 4417]CCE61347.1 hypothetical protein TPHA_0A02650 [Tetrapisispora phaffii CBS 4417]